jgi:type IV secretory pathway VirB10-like protein
MMSRKGTGRPQAATSLMPPKAASGEFEMLWSAWCNQARDPSRPSSEADGISDMLSALPKLPPPPPPLAESDVRSVIAAQQKIIEELEQQLRRGGVADSSESLGDLRRQNAAITARCIALEQQLADAQTRCRCVEDLNAKWREQYSILKKREEESWERLQRSLKRVDRADQAEQSQQKLTSALKQRSAEVVKQGQRIAELEAMVEHLRTALAVAMGTLTPEALEVRWQQSAEDAL